ncbi:MAG: hypothetical protein KIT84_36540 [Labilithrix sp.]|nr:hypothetical protein [Labilithrix sp.]MCW5816565.1 hypothetical protein [Labilithrix sp.]
MRIGSGLVIAACVALSCSSGKNDPDYEEYYEDEEIGFEVEEFAWDDVEAEELDSHWTRTETAKVEIKGLGVHEVRLTELDFFVDVEDPKSGTQVLEVEDLVTKNFRAVVFVPRESAILMESEDKDVLIIKNPDGSYTVDDQPAANGRAAVEILKQNPIFGDASPHGMLLAYSIAQKKTNWSSLMKSGVSGPTKFEGVRAESGSVCERFQDFCDCAACFKAGNVDSCSRCPK